MFTTQIIFTIISLVFYQYLSTLVSKARYDFGVKAPATTGNDSFERIHRAHLNFMENLVVFIPLLWIAGVEFANNAFYFLLCALWLVCRGLFTYSYVNHFSKKKGLIGKLGLISGITALFTVVCLGVLSVIVAF
jgi:glutathione S-transferase